MLTCSLNTAPHFPGGSHRRSITCNWIIYKWIGFISAIPRTQSLSLFTIWRWHTWGFWFEAVIINCDKKLLWIRRKSTQMFSLPEKLFFNFVPGILLLSFNIQLKCQLCFIAFLKFHTPFYPPLWLSTGKPTGLRALLSLLKAQATREKIRIGLRHDENFCVLKDTTKKIRNSSQNGKKNNCKSGNFIRNV